MAYSTPATPCARLLSSKRVEESTKEKLRAVLSEYDHGSLNDFLDYPSVENVCEMIRDKLEDGMEFSFTLRIWEGNGKWAEL